VVTWAYFPISTSPAPHDLVWCRFPDQVSLGSPGPKPRPALVRNAAINDDGHGEIELVYGTTKLKMHSRPFDFIVSQPYEMDHCGLYRATRFDLDNVVWVPWAAEWFDVVPLTESPIMGRLSDNMIRMLQTVMSYKQARNQGS
jgi:hypothetical protein